MNRVFIMRNGAIVSASINGVNHFRNFQEEEQAREFYAKCVNLKNENKIDELKKIVDNSYRIEMSEYLEKDGNGNVYMKGYNIPLPSLLVKRITEAEEDGLPITHLINFWKLCMQNPDPAARQDLFQFAERFQFPITDFGYFIAYKSVAWKGVANKHLGIHIATEYVHRKANGMDTKNILVYKSKESEAVDFLTEETFEKEMKEIAAEREMSFSIHEWVEDNSPVIAKTTSILDLEEEELVKYATANLNFIEPDFEKEVRDEYELLGTLDDQFAKINNLFENEDEAFTDWHTQKMTIKLGEPVLMSREDCDNNPNRTCSSGLHVGAPGYVKGFGGGDKNYILAVLVNPANVVAVPYDYNYEKMRVCEYYPYAICETDEDGKIKEIKTTHFEENYLGYEVEELEKELKKFEKKESFLNSINDKDIEDITTSMKDRLIVIGEALS